MPGDLTVIASIRAGEEEPLRRVLRAIGGDVRGARLADVDLRPHIHFTRSRGIHFARFTIIDHPDRDLERRRLLFSSSYDGTLEAHLDEMARITTDMDAIWGRCEGYRGVEHFAAFMKAHRHWPRALYMAFPDETVAGIQRRLAIRRALDEALDLPALVALRPEVAHGTGRLQQALTRLVETGGTAFSRVARGVPSIADVVRAIRRWGFRNVYLATKRIAAGLDRVPVVGVLNRLTRNRMPPRRSAWSAVTLDGCAPWAPLAPGDEIQSALVEGLDPGFREDAVTQNQLTLITVVNPAQLRRLEAVLSAIDSYARRFAPPGSLLGISTIHFVRWFLIDGGRRLILLSDYDGSWESYIDEFAEMILSGLDAIWESSLGYPEDGARDLPAFKHFLRAHQAPPEVFFSAYPDQTVLNIASDLGTGRSVAAGLAAAGGASAGSWLRV